MSEVRPGYKQTEVGVIPEDWEVTAFRNIAISIVSGKSKVSRTDGAYPIYGSTGVIGYSAKSDYSGDAVLIARVGANAGKLNLVNDEYGVTDNTIIVKVDAKHNLKYFWYQFDHKNLNKLVFGSGQPLITGSQIKNLEVCIPLLAEQTAIVKVLSDADALIQSLDHLISKKRNIEQGAMQGLLTGKKRLPGFSGKWEEKKIGDFAECYAGGTPSTLVPSYWGGNINWMNSGELNQKIVWNVEGRITEQGLRESSTKIIPAKCVLVGLAGQGKTRGTVAINMVELCTNQSIAAIFPSTTYISEYLLYNLDARYDELRELSAGDGGRGGLNLTIIKSLQILLPSLAEQTAIAAVLSDMDAEIATLEQKRDKYKAIKQGMMQELLTGKTRLV